MHSGQLTVSPEMVRELLATRFALKLADAGSVRRELTSEAAAARELARRTRFPTPEPVALGEPGAGYPLPWSVQAGRILMSGYRPLAPRRL